MKKLSHGRLKNPIANVAATFRSPQKLIPEEIICRSAIPGATGSRLEAAPTYYVCSV
ncbi:MAG: hypothetical protein L0Y68_08940 [Candidatus Dadabacteria bacterium]|nr:hypothetical protein [Candidatus Dadabacteria bacterium]